MSHAGNIPGISDLEVERVDRGDSIAVYARPTKRPPCIHCEHTGIKIKTTYQRTLKHTRQGNQVLTLHLRAPKYSALNAIGISSTDLRVSGPVSTPAL